MLLSVVLIALLAWLLYRQRNTLRGFPQSRQSETKTARQME